MIALCLSILVAQGTAALLCADISDSPDGKWTTEDLNTMSGEEIDKCVTELGKEKIPLEQAQIIWEKLTEYYGGPGEVPEDKLNHLHWITVAVQPSQFRNMSISNIDVIENFGLFYDLSHAQLTAIADRVREDWGGKTPEDYTSYDLMALRQIICAFEPEEIERIHPAAYKDAAAALGTLKRCPLDVLKALAKLATEEKAFGSTDTWVETTISTIGVVMDGLSPEKLQKVPDVLLKRSKERLAKATRKSISDSHGNTKPNVN